MASTVVRVVMVEIEGGGSEVSDALSSALAGFLGKRNPAPSAAAAAEVTGAGEAVAFPAPAPPAAALPVPAPAAMVPAAQESAPSKTPAVAASAAACSQCGVKISGAGSTGMCRGCATRARRQAQAQGPAQATSARKDAPAADALPPATAEKAAMLRGLTDAIGEGKKQYGAAGFDLHKSVESDVYAAVARGSRPAEGFRALLRIYRQGNGQWVETPLQSTGLDRDATRTAEGKAAA